MDRTSAPNSVGGLYVDDNESTSTQGTLIIALDQNARQEEIVNTIEGANITPSSGDDTQLLQSIQAFSQYSVETATDNVTISNKLASHLVIFTRQATLKTITLDDAVACAGCVRRIQVEGSGVGDVQMASTSSQTIGVKPDGTGISANDWLFEGTGTLTLVSDGTNWQILESGIWDTEFNNYTISSQSVDLPWEKYTDGKIVRRAAIDQVGAGTVTEAFIQAIVNPLIPAVGDKAVFNCVSDTGGGNLVYGPAVRTAATVVTINGVSSGGANTSETVDDDGTSGNWTSRDAIQGDIETTNTVWYT